MDYKCVMFVVRKTDCGQHDIIEYVDVRLTSTEASTDGHRRWTAAPWPAQRATCQAGARYIVTFSMYMYLLYVPTSYRFQDTALYSSEVDIFSYRPVFGASLRITQSEFH